MPFYAKLKIWFILLLIAAVAGIIWSLNRRVTKLENYLHRTGGIISLEMYENLERYSDSFNIPKHIAYNIAYQETGYRGPLHWDYNPNQTSSAGAVGPMQIIPKYAHYFAGRKVTAEELKDSVELSVRISMKMLRYWYNIHKDWTLACGAYNSGRPIRNEYAVTATTNKDYKNRWIKSAE